MESLEVRANALRKQREYKEAITLYTKAINTSMSCPNLSLHDGRAACYERLNCLSQAMADEYAITILRKSHIKGYLRVGKIHQLLNQDELALRCYRGAEKYIQKCGRHAELLQQMISSVDERLVSEFHAMDLFKLPLEIVLEIFRYIPFRQVMICRGVSRAWNNAIERKVKAYRRLDFSHEVATTARSKRTRVPTTQQLLTCINKAGGSLAALCISFQVPSKLVQHAAHRNTNIGALTLPIDNLLLASIKFCRNLRHLELIQIDKSPPIRPISYPDIFDILNLCVNLMSVKTLIHRPDQSAIVQATSSRVRCIDFGRFRGVGIPFAALKCLTECTELQSLRIPFVHLGPVEIVHDLDTDTYTSSPVICSRWPLNLESLKVDSFDAGQVLDRGSTLKFCLTVPRSLKALSIGCQDIELVKLDAPPTLRSLSITMRPKTVQFTTLLSIISHMKPSLQNFELCGHDLQQAELSLLLDNLRDLRQLSLRPEYTSNEAIVDNTLEHISLQNTKLESLSLVKCRKFSGAALARCISQCPSFSSLSLENCTEIDLDVVSWLRARGVQVRVNVATD